MKLYWRIKKNGKWTWRPAEFCHLHWLLVQNVHFCKDCMEEEE